MQVDVQFPAKLDFLFQPARYKVLHGGRGGSKSWGIARALLLEGSRRPLRVLCGRETQKSIADSVHRLLADQITALGLEGFYEIQNATIIGKNDTRFTFHGLKHNISNIKSVEGSDIAWLEEAKDVSKNSWETLIPTIRKECSEIWISFNPELEEDETYERFVKNPPPGAVVVEMNYDDNPWFPQVLRDEMEYLKEKDFAAYETVWLGKCRQTIDGAIYAEQIAAAKQAGRFTSIPYNESKPVLTFWDLGRADKTSIWFMQQVGFEYRFIDYYENRGKALAHYLKVLRERPYLYGDTWLPHDAENELLASEKTIKKQCEDANFKCRIAPKLAVTEGINAVRTVFSQCFFDEAKCKDGLSALRRYRFEVDPDTGQFSKNPLHDDASHAADAFRYFAVSNRTEQSKHKINYPKSGVV